MACLLADDVRHATPLVADDVFDSASLTKQFTAAGVLKLVETGKVSPDDPLSKFVKDYPGGDKVTVRELLNHTSGIKSYTDTPQIDGVVNKDTTTAQLIDVFKNEKPEFAPGTSWAYDNSGYALLGAVIEAASGMPWHVYLRKTLFVPLGMNHTGYAGDPAIAARRVHGYIVANGKALPAPAVSIDHPFAEGALASTVDDLLRWNRALHEGRVLKDKNYRQMITPVGSAVPEQYGFGLWRTSCSTWPILGASRLTQCGTCANPKPWNKVIVVAQARDSRNRAGCSFSHSPRSRRPSTTAMMRTCCVSTS